MMPNEERDRILRMVAEGTITPAEASDLLSAIAGPPRPPARPAPISGIAVPRNLTIQIVDGDDTSVNIRIPLALARAAGKFIPRQAQSYLNAHEINLEAIMESLQANDGENTLLEVVDGETNIRIAVE
jgi:hypothetical protein